MIDVTQVHIMENANETEINEWLQKNLDIENVRISQYELHDNNNDGSICNQWIQTLIIYTEKQLAPSK